MNPLRICWEKMLGFSVVILEPIPSEDIPAVEAYTIGSGKNRGITGTTRAASNLFGNESFPHFSAASDPKLKLMAYKINLSNNLCASLLN